MITLGNIYAVVWRMFSTVVDIISTVDGYDQCIGWRVISTVGDIIVLWGIPLVLWRMFSTLWVTPPSSTDGIPHTTEHPLQY